MSLPFMPDGFASAGIAEDELDGGGVIYDPIRPTYLDSFEAELPVIMTDDKTAAFDACADLVIAPQNDIITIKGELDTVVIRRDR